MAHTIRGEGSATLRRYRNNDNTIGTLGKMTVKLPMPTQFDGRNPQFREWIGEVNAYLTITMFTVEDSMDVSATSVDAIDTQDAY
eukprot:703173-Amphidinium_carterae.2